MSSPADPDSKSPGGIRSLAAGLLATQSEFDSRLWRQPPPVELRLAGHPSLFTERPVRLIHKAMAPWPIFTN
jgi:hypothetical protein